MAAEVVIPWGLLWIPVGLLAFSAVWGLLGLVGMGLNKGIVGVIDLLPEERLPRPLLWFFRTNPESPLFGTWIANAITLAFIIWMIVRVVF